VSQSELDDAIGLHGLWLENRKSGRRADFASCNLSGLDFGYGVMNQILLRNADFTDADLSGIGGNDVNFHHASLQYADLAGANLKSPVFCHAILNGANCRSVVWGWPWGAEPNGGDQPPTDAVFMNTSLSGAVLDGARVRGFFYDCSLTAASLDGTDLSRSRFVGPAGGNRFGGARLIDTSFRHAEISTVGFKRAVIERPDFLHAVIAPEVVRQLLGRNLTTQPG
jgi:uncharacterized protein YjbI with pentapeptide repeats